ncbi:hypothetical protein Tco_0452752 [Tanacetum coccineum]
MCLSHITISSDSDAQSVGSSASLVILSVSEASVVVVHSIAPEFAPEVTPEAEAAIVAPSSPDYVSTLPDYFLRSDSKANSEESPEEDPLEYDSFGDDTLEAVGPLAVQAVPAPLQIVHALPASPCRPAILVRPGQAIPFD